MFHLPYTNVRLKFFNYQANEHATGRRRLIRNSEDVKTGRLQKAIVNTGADRPQSRRRDRERESRAVGRT